MFLLAKVTEIHFNVLNINTIQIHPLQFTTFKIIWRNQFFL